MNQFQILESKVQDDKLLYRLQHKSEPTLHKWVSFDYLSKRKDGLELIQQFNQKDYHQSSDSEQSFIRKRPLSCYSLENGDSIKCFELIGTTDQEGSEHILKVHPRKWVFKVSWNKREQVRMWECGYIIVLE